MDAVAIRASRRNRSQFQAALRRAREREGARWQGHPTDPDGYLGEIGKRIFACMGIVGVGYLVIGGLSALRASEEGSTSPRITLQPLDAGIVAGAYGILAAFVMALQFASRSMTPSQKHAQPGATAFLNLLAQAILLSTLALTAATVFTQEDIPKSFDLYRMAGPMLLCTLIALPAAEAAMLTDQRSSVFLQLDSQQRSIQRMRELQSHIPGARLGKIGWLIQSLAVALIILLTTGLSFVFRPSVNHQSFGLRVAFATLTTLIAFALLQSLVKALIAKDYASFAWQALMATVVCLLYLLDGAQHSMHASGSQQLLLRTVTRDAVAHGMILVGPFCALIPLCLNMPLFRCRGVILDIVSRSFDRRLAKLLAHDSRVAKPRVNRLAITALALLPFVPFSVLVAHMARIQIAKTGERGDRLVRVALISAATLATLVLVALLLLTTIPIVGDWCPGTVDEICWSIER